MTHDQMIEVIAAHYDGKPIQSHRKFGTGFGNKWCDCTAPSWNFEYFTYRVKPEPKTLYFASKGNTGYLVCPKDRIDHYASRGFAIEKFIQDTDFVIPESQEEEED